MQNAPTLRAVAEGRSHREGADHAERIHGASPVATGKRWARHSATPSSKATA